MESNIDAATFIYLSSDEASALMDEDFSIYFSESPSQTNSAAAYTADNGQPLPSLSTPRTTTPTGELPFDHYASLEINSMTLGQDEIAAETARIRRKWVEEKDTLMARLVVDLTKPEIGSICQWERLVNSVDVVLDDFLPENIPNLFQHNKKVIESFADWTVAFMSFRKAVLYIFKHRGPELDAHFVHISKLYRDSYSIKLILAYEKDVRHHMATMPDLSLFSDFSSLWNKHFMNVQSTTSAKKTREQKQICPNYNSHFKRCKTSKKCSRLHICSICFNSMKVQRKHPAAFCPAQRSNGRRKHPSRLPFTSNVLSITSQGHRPSHYPY
ncbi:unnamed protein product [Adineta steineri]|uniref:C3H1-type domain-containing protein n=1 Tax=Adineta steineri TaxID=433720 RepID=A0A815RJX7_9BILA|nr:unnamed protein product [Adineta steineri]CAF1637524.1 unnamed protein product [Adineta steineri]